MNQQQISDALRVGLAAGGPVAALILKYTGITADDYALWLAAALLVVPPTVAWVWGYYRNTAAATVKRAESLPEVATVVIKDSANGALQKLAADETHPNIVTETQNEADAKQGHKTP